jgi:hypothetical protein
MCRLTQRFSAAPTKLLKMQMNRVLAKDRFKTFRNAQVTLSGIELANKIKKGQFDTSEITGPGAMILQVWEAVLAA